SWRALSKLDRNLIGIRPEMGAKSSAVRASWRRTFSGNAGLAVQLHQQVLHRAIANEGKQWRSDPGRLWTAAHATGRVAQSLDDAAGPPRRLLHPARWSKIRSSIRYVHCV